MREREQLLAQRDQVVREPRGLERRVEAAHQPLVLRGDAGRAMARVAPLGLDAADGQHRFARDVDHVAADREGEQRGLLGKPQLARTANTRVLAELRAPRRSGTRREAELEGERDVVREHQRRGARAALAAVDGDEVEPASGGVHFGRQVTQKSIPDRRLDADGQPRRLGEPLDEVEHRRGVMKGRVRRRAEAVLPERDQPDLRDLRRHLLLREHAPEAGLGALRQLDLDGPHLRRGDALHEALHGEPALGVAAPEVARPDLPEHVAAVPVVVADAPFSVISSSIRSGGSCPSR